MSLYYYFSELKKDLTYTEDNFEDLDGSEMGEDLAAVVAHDLGSDKFGHFEYEQNYNNEDGDSGYIIDFVYNDALENLPEETELIDLLGRSEEAGLYNEFQPYICFYTKEEVKFLFEKLTKFKEKFQSKYINLYLEILAEAQKREVGIVIWAN